MGFGRRTVAAAAVGTGGGGCLAAAARCGIAPVGGRRFGRFPVIPPRPADGRPSENGCVGCRTRLGGVFSDGLPSSAVRYRHGGRGADADTPRPARTRRAPPRHTAAVPPRYRPRRRRTADYPCTQAPRGAGRTARILRRLRPDAGAKLPHRPAMGMGRRAFRTPCRRRRSRRRQRPKLRPARRDGRYGVYRNRRPRHQRRTKTAGTLRPKPVQPSLGAGASRQQRLVVGRIPQRRLPRLRHCLQRLRQQLPPPDRRSAKPRPRTRHPPAPHRPPRRVAAPRASGGRNGFTGNGNRWTIERQHSKRPSEKLFPAFQTAFLPPTSDTGRHGYDCTIFHAIRSAISNSRMPKPFFSLSAGSLWERRTPKGADSKVAAARMPTAGR